ARRREKGGSVFCRGVYVTGNTSQPVSVRMVRLRRTMRARNGLHPARKSGKATFSTVSRRAFQPEYSQLSLLRI
ncbi:hypothetical protein, partial [Candidatus Pseudoscillospira sp. SGI.172]|uniref:hypothetical protein n=1 Tax=Candidatus Pseudoscillospira sp. SGI.172 TaxID=3420582 RepID=UPI003CFED3FB